MGLMIALLFFAVPTLSQTEVKSTLPPLRLTTRIIQQRYCDSGYSDMASLSLSLRLTYTNMSSRAVILYKGSNLMHYLLVSATEQDARDKHYELNMHVGWVTSEGNVIEGSKPGKEFVVLAPQSSYELEGGIVSMPVDLDSTTKFLRAGPHVFQGVTETWSGNEDQFARLKKKWENVGELWGNNVRSEPIPLSVDKNPKVVKCE